MAFEFTARQPEPASDAATGRPGGPDGTGLRELKKRLLFTLLALLAFRLGAHIPLPGIDAVALHDLLARQGGGITGLLDLFSGGAFGRMSILALGVIPMIAASIIMLLMTAAVPALGKLATAGAAGRETLNRYARYLTLLFAAVQGYGIAVALEHATGSLAPVVADPGLVFEITFVATVAGGAMLLLWLAEQITSRGVGDGVPLIVFAGIAANLPAALAQVLELGRMGVLPTPLLIGLLVLAVAMTGFIVFMERATRRIVVQYSGRPAGGRRLGGESGHLPLKPNLAGVLPPIFATSLMLLPAAFAGFGGGGGPEWVATIATLLGRGQPAWLLIQAVLIVSFAFFCTAAALRPADTAHALEKYGGFIPGIRPGKATADYLGFVSTRLTAAGAVYLAAACLLPEILIPLYHPPTYFGGTGSFFRDGTSLFFLGGPSLFILVRGTMDTAGQIRAHILAAYGGDGA